MGKVDRVKKRVDRLRSKGKNERADKVEQRFLQKDADQKLLGRLGGELDMAKEAEETLMSQGANKLKRMTFGGRTDGSRTYSGK